jgi:hypothetical protein
LTVKVELQLGNSLLLLLLASEADTCPLTIHQPAHLRLVFDNSFLQDLTVKVELQLGNSLPPLLVGAATHSKLEGNMYPLQTIANMAKRNAGCELTPDFSAAAVIVRERAVGQANKSLPRVIQVRDYCCHHALVSCVWQWKATVLAAT